MKAILSSLVTLSLIAGLAGHADAASRQQKKRLKAGHSSSYAAKARGYRKPAASAGAVRLEAVVEHLRRAARHPGLSAMKTISISLAALALATGLSGQADAATPRKKRPPVVQSGASYSNPLAANGYTGYYERVLDKVPFGSQLWWRVYDSYPKGR